MTKSPPVDVVPSTAARLRAAVWPENPALRVLAGATLVNTVGTGAFFTVSALYFTRIVGIPVGQLGLRVACAG